MSHETTFRRHFAFFVHITPKRHIISSHEAGSKTLARDDAHVASAARLHESLVRNPLCRVLYATADEQRSCFNDQLACAITLHRRANATAAAERVLHLARAHPHAATRWTTHAQTPRVFEPNLEVNPPSYFR